MKDQISEGPLSCVYYLLFPLKNSLVVIPNKWGVEPSVYVKLGGVLL